MKTGSINIIILPCDPSKGIQLRLSSLHIKAVVWAGIILLAAFIISLYNYTTLKRKAVSLGKVEDLAKSQRLQLQTYADKVSTIETEMLRIKTLYMKINEMTDKRVKTHLQNSPPVSDGKGGPEGSPRTYLKREGFIDGMMERLNRLETEIRDGEVNLHELHSFLERRKMRQAAVPSLQPVRGHITSSFGERESPFSTGAMETHEGLDIAAPFGAPVTAAANGVVVSAGMYPDYGYAVTINHGYGFFSKYGHLSAISVRSGQKVRMGQKIGSVGSTGRSTGPHLHYEVAVNGFKVNPVKYLAKKVDSE